MDGCVELGLTRPHSPSNALVCSTPAQEQSGNSASGYDRTRSRKLNNEWQQTYVQHITKRSFTLRLYKLTLANTKLHIWREVCRSNSTPLSQVHFLLYAYIQDPYNHHWTIQQRRPSRIFALT